MGKCETPAADDQTYGIAADRLRSLVGRIERLEEERRGLAGDIRDIYAEAKSAGFDVKVLRQIVRERRESRAEREGREALLDFYRRALGMLADTPLGAAAMESVRAPLRDLQTVAKKAGARITMRAGDGPEVELADGRTVTA